MPTQPTQPRVQRRHQGELSSAAPGDVLIGMAEAVPIPPPAATADPDSDSDEEPTATDKGGGGSTTLTQSSGRLILLAAGAMVGAVPLVVAAGVERCMGRSRTKQWLWNRVGIVLNDAAGVAAFAAPTAYGQVRWRWPSEHFPSGRKVVALTIDDAPGDNPEGFREMLDIMKEHSVRCTFMCMTDSVVGPMVALLQRAVDEGHELANHCPADRSYSLHRRAAFASALHESEAVLRPYKKRQREAPTEAYLSRCDVQRKWPRMKWFRPPMGHMSSAMGAVLKEDRYSVALGDFSNDVTIGGTATPDTPTASSSAASYVKYHASFYRRCVKSGSIIIFHVPRKRDRALAPAFLRATIEAMRADEPATDFLCLSEVACLADEGSATAAAALAAGGGAGGAGTRA